MSIYLKSGTVKPEWTDYNNHMNLAYYIHLFDVSWEIILEQFTMGEDSAKNHGKGTFAVESHTTYDMEVQLGDEVDINLMFFDHDKKRIICKMEMINKQKQYIAFNKTIGSDPGIIFIHGYNSDMSGEKAKYIEKYAKLKNIFGSENL